MKYISILISVLLFAGCSSKPFKLGDTTNDEGLVVFSTSYTNECSRWFAGHAGSSFVIKSTKKGKGHKGLGVIMSNMYIPKDFKENNTTVHAKKVKAGEYVTEYVHVSRMINSFVIFNVAKNEFKTPAIKLKKVEAGKAQYWGSFLFYDPKGGDCSDQFDIKVLDKKQRDVKKAAEKEPAAKSLL